MPRYLVVANQTLGGERLMEEIRSRVAAGSSTFHLLVPLTPFDDWQTAWRWGWTSGDTGPTAAAIERRDQDVRAARHRAETTAQSRLSQLLGQIRAIGSEAQGEIGDSDPVKAIDAAMAAEDFDEIIISTLPEGVSHWLRMDVPNRVKRKFKIPVTTVTSKK
jgi:hypothetical protein